MMENKHLVTKFALLYLENYPVCQRWIHISIFVAVLLAAAAFVAVFAAKLSKQPKSSEIQPTQRTQGAEF